MLSENNFSSLDSQIMKLNPEQREAVTTVSGPLLILAGAGSGKTRVLVNRVAYLVEKKKINPKNILALSFTNKAANEMKERVKSLLGAKNTKGMILSTFHSLGVKILKKEIRRLDYKAKFTIYSQSEQLSAIRSIIGDLQADSYKPDEYLRMVSAAKNKNLKEIPSGFSDDKVFNKFLTEVYREYISSLKLYNAVDFDDLLFLPVKIFDLYPEVLEEYQELFRYIMIDEYQDTNHLQYIFVKGLTASHRNICVVGDDDQSIYGFRGAEVKNILNFEKDFPDAKIIKLEQNYRSTNTILEAANELIKNNSLRKEKNLWSDKGKGQAIDWIITDSQSDEAEVIAERIESLIYYKKVPHSKILVLLRTNFNARIFEEEFRSRSIPYRLVGGKTLFDRKELKDLVAYLKVFLNPDDDINLLRIINFPIRGIGKGSVKKLLEEGRDKKLSVWEVINRPSDELNQVLKKTGSFVSLVKKYHEIFKNPPGIISTHQEVENFLEESNFLAHLVSEKKDTKKAMRSRENILDFVSFFKKIEEKKNGISLEKFLDKMSLNNDILQNKKDDDKNEGLVTIMTLHCSKGLEFEYVFMVGMEEEIFPHIRSINTPGGIEEERRLCYVGITRAKTHLTMSMAGTRKKWGNEEKRLPSRFIEELPKHLVSSQDGQFSDLNEEESEIAAEDFFGKIQDI